MYRPPRFVTLDRWIAVVEEQRGELRIPWRTALLRNHVSIRPPIWTQKPLLWRDKGLKLPPDLMLRCRKVVVSAGGIDQLKCPKLMQERCHVRKET